jgi:hypothetical protein
LAETVEKWARKPPPATLDDLDARRENFVVDLTASALYVALKNGIQPPFLEVERGLYSAFQQVIRRGCHVN